MDSAVIFSSIIRSIPTYRFEIREVKDHRKGSLVVAGHMLLASTWSPGHMVMSLGIWVLARGGSSLLKGSTWSQKEGEPFLIVVDTVFFLYPTTSFQFHQSPA